MDRRLAKLAPSVATATLALMTAAWAATGDVPLVRDERTQALAVAAAATGPLVANDHDGVAVLTAPAMAPGATAAGEVTISNAGDAAGRVSLAAGAPAAAGGPAGGLSAVLELTVSDVTGAAPVALYTGKLAAFRGLGLGTFAAGGAHRYRFAVTYPAGRSAAMDDPYQGASTSLGLTWTATAIASAPPPAPAPATAPAAPAAPAASAPAAPAAPAPTTSAPPASALTVTLGTAKKPVANGRLVTWLQSPAAATARVTGTVSFTGHKVVKLRATTVQLTAAKRRTVQLKLPAAAVAPGAKRKLTVRLAVTATAGGRTAIVKRTLRVTAP
jgi:spore coat-associated protein N